MLSQQPAWIPAVVAMSESSSESIILDDGTIISIVHLPTPIITIDEIPIIQREIVVDAMADIFGISTPRNFQIEAVNHVAFDDGAVMFIIQPTAKGKSLIPLATAVIRCGMTIVLVPLIGLGSDQPNQYQQPTNQKPTNQ